jgi:hypothetical protein
MTPYLANVRDMLGHLSCVSHSSGTAIVNFSSGKSHMLSAVGMKESDEADQNRIFYVVDDCRGAERGILVDFDVPL